MLATALSIEAIASQRRSSATASESTTDSA